LTVLESRRVCRALNDRFTIAGYGALELLMVYLTLYYAATFFGLFVGAICLTAAAIALKYAKGQDPRFWEVLFLGRKFHKHFDAAISRRPTWYSKS
jgi:type IV secretory pathway TrbD component